MSGITSGITKKQLNKALKPYVRNWAIEEMIPYFTNYLELRWEILNDQYPVINKKILKVLREEGLVEKDNSIYDPQDALPEDLFDEHQEMIVKEINNLINLFIKMLRAEKRK